MNIASVLQLRWVGAIVLLTGVLVACDRSINVEEVIDRAAVLHETGAHRASIIELKNAVREDPANARARQLLGENYIELGDADSAEKELRRALDLGVDAAVLAVPLARVMLLQGRYEDALDAAEAEAAPAGSARAAVLVVRGRAYGSLADMDAAEAAFRAALNEDRSSVDAHVGLARTALRQADFAHATVVLKDAMELAPDGPSVIELAGDLSYAQGDYAASEVAFVTLVSAAPDDPFYRARLVQALMAQSKNTQAIAHLDTILTDFPSYPLANYMRAVIAYEAGDYRLAKLHGERALAAIPDHRPSQLLAGAASYAEGQHEQARSYLQDYVTAVPEDQQARRLLGVVQLRLGDASQAVTTLSPLVAETEGDAQLLAMIGSAALEAKDLQAGRTDFERLAALDPDSAAAQAQLGLIQVALGDVEQGIDALSRAVQTNPELDRAQVALILAQLRAREFDKAVVSAERLQALRPDDAAGYVLAGIAFLGLEDEVAAHVAFTRAVEIQPGAPDASSNLATLELRRGNVDTARQLILDVLEHHPDDLGTRER